MSRVPYFPFYPSDFMTGVRGLTPSEVGIYTMLLCRIYEESGPISADSRVLAAYCGTRVVWFENGLAKLIALGKIKTDGATLWNDRAIKEIADRARNLEANSRAGKISAQKRKQNQQPASTDVQRTFNHTDTDKKTVAKATDAERVTNFADALWTNGVAYLVRHGTAEKQARSLIGKWRKANGDEAVYGALAAANKAAVAEPVAYITAALKEPADQKLDAWGIPDAKPVRLERGVGHSDAIASARAPDVPRVQPSPKGQEPTSSLFVGHDNGGWAGGALPSLRLVSGCVS